MKKATAKTPRQGDEESLSFYVSEEVMIGTEYDACLESLGYRPIGVQENIIF